MTATRAKPTLLRIGIIIESFLQPRWVRKSLENVLATGLGTFALVVKVEAKRNGGALLYKLYNRLDRRLYPTSASELVDIKDLLSEVPVIEDVEKIAEFSVDLLMNFASSEWNKRVSNSSKHGVWFHTFGDAPGFHELMYDVSLTNLSLKSLHGETEQLIYHSVSPTLSRFSVSVNNNNCYWKAAAFMARALRDLQAGGNIVVQLDHRWDKPGTPGNAKMAHTFLKLSGRAAARAFEKVSSFNQWIVAYRFDNDEFKYLIPPADRFWADPFQLKVDGRYYIFFEDYVNSAGRAHISVVEVDRNGIVSGPTEVLKLDCHLSYPFVFEWDGKFYLVPESAENRTIDLYECVEFPVKWKFKMSLMENIRAVDTTLWFYDNKWWLFTGMTENEEAFPQVGLFLFISNNLFTNEWRPHPLNPIVADVKNARPAGRIFRKDGKIYRPSQDCSKGYGYGFYLNEIVSLSETEYMETKVFSVKPDWDKNILGVHTYSVTGNLTVVDAFTRRMKFISDL